HATKRLTRVRRANELFAVASASIPTLVIHDTKVATVASIPADPAHAIFATLTWITHRYRVGAARPFNANKSKPALAISNAVLTLGAAYLAGIREIDT